MKDFRIGVLMAGTAPHHSSSSTIRTALHSHGMRLCGRTKKRRVTWNMTIEAAWMPQNRGGLLKSLE
jgi:hypothetical protein